MSEQHKCDGEHRCIICRCEEVYLDEIVEAIHNGCTDINQVKKRLGPAWDCAKGVPVRCWSNAL